MMPILQLGPLALPARPMVMLAAFWLSAYLAEREGNRLGLNGEWVWSWAGVTALSGLLGARAAYVVENWASYHNDLAGMLALNLLPMDWTAGTIVAVLVAIVYLQRRGPPLALFVDSLAPALAVGLTLSSLGALLSGDAFGTPTSLPWAIELWGTARHPTQVYEMIVGLAALAVVQRSRRLNLPTGHTFWRGAATYAAGRLIVEAFHADSLLLPGGFRLVQVLSLAVLMLALWALRPPSSASQPERDDVRPSTLAPDG
jgi:prolipoprotein diacylglyceryltransferase